MQTGFDWEAEFADACRSKGMSVQETKHGYEYDLIVNGHRIQCKHTEFLDGGRIRISRGSSCSAARNYKPDAFDFFAIRFRGLVFIVPVRSVGVSGDTIRRRINLDRLWKFKDRFDLLRQPAHRPLHDFKQLSFEYE